MGLDMFAYRIPKGIINKPVDFDIDESLAVEIHFWRKHPDLHGWMENLYREKGGNEFEFNLQNLQLNSEDLDNLEKDILNSNLPETSGFFFGSSNGKEIDDDLNFVRMARESISNGYDVYYSSWW